MRDDWHLKVPRNDGESQEQCESRIRFLQRLSDWSEDDYPRVNRNGRLLSPLAELRRRIFQIPWNRPKR